MVILNSRMKSVAEKKVSIYYYLGHDKARPRQSIESTFSTLTLTSANGHAAEGAGLL